MPKGVFEVPVEKMLLDLLHDCGKPGIEAGCKGVPEDIEQELLQVNWHLVRWGRFRSFQRLGDGHGFLWLGNLLLIGMSVPRGHIVHEEASKLRRR